MKIKHIMLGIGALGLIGLSSLTLANIGSEIIDIKLSPQAKKQYKIRLGTTAPAGFRETAPGNDSKIQLHQTEPKSTAPGEEKRVTFDLEPIPPHEKTKQTCTIDLSTGVIEGCPDLSSKKTENTIEIDSK